ncbi:sodium/proton antiporter [Alcanivorax balearicus MACL04]|uniref:Sodium/proton antiporter n=1 Tax=Alloalcanivorax balearicus MACL04 TaxID=1177182 RepID=A0ABT2R0H9_9GAMM|nr:sodium/proton antiporter [Alloalcanivorax balearicus MACL04]
MSARIGRALGQNFLGQTPAWYKYANAVFLLINRLMGWVLGPEAAGWLPLAEFIIIGR